METLTVSSVAVSKLSKYNYQIEPNKYPEDSVMNQISYTLIDAK